jgi:endonuclease/exonuclease/phosphatase family metal-dependent hydrolase
MRSVDLSLFTPRSKTYPGILPMLHLDHVYFDDRLRLENFIIHRTRKALMASDHLPLVADFYLPEETEG